MKIKNKSTYGNSRIPLFFHSSAKKKTGKLKKKKSFYSQKVYIFIFLYT